MIRMRRMIGGEHRDGAVGDTLLELFDIGCGPQGRVHLRHRVVSRAEILCQQQVVR